MSGIDALLIRGGYRLQDGALAATLGIKPEAVGRRRRELEERGRIPHVHSKQRTCPHVLDDEDRAALAAWERVADPTYYSKLRMGGGSQWDATVDALVGRGRSGRVAQCRRAA